MPSITIPRLRSQEFTANGNWVCPRGVTQAIVMGCGGGAGGWAPDSFGGAGGFGAPVDTQVVTVVPGTTYAITIGSGGSGGIEGGADPTNGTASTFGVLATFQGGKNQSTTITGVGYGGGRFEDNGVSSPYASGGIATVINGTNGGSGGGASLGAGGNGGANSSGASGHPGQYGGGGGGGSNAAGANNGGAGGAGKVIVYWIDVKW